MALAGMSEMVVPHAGVGSSVMGLSAEDMIDFYKVMPCPRTSNHDWSTCFYSHPSEKARRRSLAQHWYSAIFCVDMLHKSACKQGESCNLAHSVFEYWMHPDKFRTKYCRDGVNCKRTICFFAHGPHELRHPGEYTPRTPGSFSCTSFVPSALPLDSSSTISPRAVDMAADFSQAPINAAAVAVGMGAACYGDSSSNLRANVVKLQNNSTNNHMLSILTPGASAANGSGSQQLQPELVLLQRQQPHMATGVAMVTASSPSRLQLQDAFTSEATEQVARLKLEYDKKIAEAELAAAKAAEASNLLQQFASALTVSSDSASALLASSPATTPPAILAPRLVLSAGNSTPMTVSPSAVTGQTVLSLVPLDSTQLLQQLQLPAGNTAGDLKALTGPAEIHGVVSTPCGSTQLLQLPAFQASQAIASSGQVIMQYNPHRVLAPSADSYQWY